MPPCAHRTGRCTLRKRRARTARRTAGTCLQNILDKLPSSFFVVPSPSLFGRVRETTMSFLFIGAFGICIGTLTGQSAKQALSLLRPRVDTYPPGVLLPAQCADRIRDYSRARIHLEEDCAAFLAVVVDRYSGLNFFVCTTTRGARVLHVRSAVYSESCPRRRRRLVRKLYRYASDQLNFSAI